MSWNEYGVLVGDDEEVSGTDSCDSYITLWRYLLPLNWILTSGDKHYILPQQKISEASLHLLLESPSQYCIKHNDILKNCMNWGRQGFLLFGYVALACGRPTVLPRSTRKAGNSKKAVETEDRIVITFWESSHGKGCERASRDVGHGLFLIYLSYLSS